MHLSLISSILDTLMTCNIHNRSDWTFGCREVENIKLGGGITPDNTSSWTHLIYHLGSCIMPMKFLNSAHSCVFAGGGLMLDLHKQGCIKTNIVLSALICPWSSLIYIYIHAQISPALAAELALCNAVKSPACAALARTEYLPRVVYVRLIIFLSH